jgi:hypothetical protein
MKSWGGGESGCIDPDFSFISALVGGKWSASRPCHFALGEGTPGTQWIGVWVDYRAGLNDMEK